MSESASTKKHRLTPHQRQVLEALANGSMITADRNNCLQVDGITIQPVTREFLVKSKYVERADKSRSLATAGNGFVITDKGREALSTATR